MPKRWRREERRRLASEEASRLANLARQTGIDDGHQSWRNLVVCSANKEDTTIATSTESVTIAAGQALDLPVHINTKTAVVHYAFKVAEMDVTVSAMILPSETKTKDPNTATTTTTTHSHLIVLDTILLPSSKGWLRGQFTPAMCGTCTFQLSNEYSFFNSKEVLFEIKVRDDVYLTSQWKIKMKKFHNIHKYIVSNDTTLTRKELLISIQQLRIVQFELENIVCDAGSACLSSTIRSEMFVTRSVLELEEFKYNQHIETKKNNTDEALKHWDSDAKGDTVARYLHNIHFLPTRSIECWNRLNLTLKNNGSNYKMKAIQSMTNSRLLRRDSNSNGSENEKNATASSSSSFASVDCTPERIVTFLTSKHVFAEPYEHIGSNLSQRIVAAALSASSATSASSTTTATSATSSKSTTKAATKATTTTTTSSSSIPASPASTGSKTTVHPIHLELFKRIAPSSSSLASLLRTYESISNVLLLQDNIIDRENEHQNESQKYMDVSLLNGQIMYVLQVLADLSFDPNGNNVLRDIIDFQTSVLLLRYVSCIVYEWCVDSDVSERSRSNNTNTSGSNSTIDMEDWKEKVHVLLLQTFNVDDPNLTLLVSNTLKSKVNEYCGCVVCWQLEEATRRSGNSIVVWQKDVGKYCWKVLNVLLDRPKAGLAGVVLFKCGDSSMLMERV